MSTVTISPAPSGNRLLYRFLFIAAALFLLWFFGYEQWLKPDGRLDTALCAQITAAGVGLLQLLGFKATISPELSTLVMMSGKPAVVIGAPCNGLVLYMLFAGFVAAFPGPWLRKLWYIPAGIVLIWCLNVVRVAALAINHYYSQQSVDFNHHYTFTFVVYGFIFGLWMLWAKRLAIPAQSSSTPRSSTDALRA
ncbi:exosortase X [Hymenobacter arizonensis]|uniref:Exosortase family protein XrtF n=1 Tax=Hymenobacter arizonensis TaxID=1227077 RepID=A0A1I5Y4V1_HYMAR|nr:archaeosortase/exosortase family protein [Hymenobacter arizonensis]SFQ39226.1 exosortase family protein XrtF [Hymenobacter arizonensis]